MLAEWLLKDNRAALVFVLACGGYLGVEFLPGLAYYRLYSLVISAASVGFILSALSIEWLKRFLLSTQMQFLGSTSYGIYLFHYPVYKYVNPRLPQHHIIAVVTCATATIVVAFLCSILIERRFIRYGAILANVVTNPPWSVGGDVLTKRRGA